MYDKGHTIEHVKYYPNGIKQCHVVFKKDKPELVEGWDQNGNIIPGYIYEQVAGFPGGMDEWRDYLKTNMYTNMPVSFKDGTEDRSVMISFAIDTSGNTIDVKVEKRSGNFDIDLHAVNIIINSPKWTPAIQYNRKVKYRRRQSMTYTIVDEKEEKRRRGL